jgi:formylglycine-generating enzyme required for sulfatase activity
MGSSTEETTRDLESVPSEEIPLARSSMAMEHPQHAVNIGRSFAVGKYPVTRGEFAVFVQETGYSIHGSCTLFANHTYKEQAEAGWQNPGFTQTDGDPVVCVNWLDARAYLTWLNGKLRGGASIKSDGPYRMPSEAQWEYAARAGTRTQRWWGNSIGAGNADCDGCGSQWDKKRTAPVGSFQISPFGLSDMLGNAWHWTEDCWNESYAGAPGDGSAWTTGKCELRTIRGGGWPNLAWILRSADRSRADPNRRANYLGFRVAKAPP